MNNKKPWYNNFPYLSVDEYFEFPPYQKEFDGIISTGGNLSPGMLMSAYLQGIFPWYGKDEPIMWWSPDPRFVLYPKDLHIPKSLQKVIKRNEKLLLQKTTLGGSSPVIFVPIL